MFIPIHAKADITGSKKGKFTPAQASQLNAWCLASKTGILDCLDKCEATETIYTATNNEATVVFKKGYIVICGRLIECEEGTEIKVITPTSGTATGKIILRYSLSNAKEAEFVVTTKSASLIQQDLNDNPLTGIYEFELYSYTATPTSVALTRTGSYVPDISGKLDEFEQSLTAEGKPLGGYDTSKGTIEERLTRLGFKSGTIQIFGEMYGSTEYTNTIEHYGIYRQGNFVIGHIQFTKKYDLNLQNDYLIKTYTGAIKIPELFRPKTPSLVTMYGKVGFASDVSVLFEIGTDGISTVKEIASGVNFDLGDTANWVLSFGYEAQPL